MREKDIFPRRKAHRGKEKMSSSVSERWPTAQARIPIRILIYKSEPLRINAKAKA